MVCKKRRGKKTQLWQVELECVYTHKGGKKSGSVCRWRATVHLCPVLIYTLNKFFCLVIKFFMNAVAFKVNPKVESV